MEVKIVYHQDIDMYAVYPIDARPCMENKINAFHYQGNAIQYCQNRGYIVSAIV